MNSLKRDLLKGIFFVLAAGSLAHFIYEWSGYSTAAGLFFPVNESTWEHMKLCFFPMLGYSFYLYFKFHDAKDCVLFSMLSGTLAGTFAIPVIFYTYTGVLGYHTLFLDLLTFFFSVLTGFCIAYRTALSCPPRTKALWILIAVILIVVCFMAFTYSPPSLGVFEVPE